MGRVRAFLGNSEQQAEEEEERQNSYEYNRVLGSSAAQTLKIPFLHWL